MFTMFREESNEDGKQGPISMRRVLAFILTLCAIALFAIGGFYFLEKGGWFAFIPGITCLAGSLLLLFFTTWNDIAEIAKAIKK